MLSLTLPGSWLTVVEHQTGSENRRIAQVERPFVDGLVIAACGTYLLLRQQSGAGIAVSTAGIQHSEIRVKKGGHPAKATRHRSQIEGSSAFLVKLERGAVPPSEVDELMDTVWKGKVVRADLEAGTILVDMQPPGDRQAGPAGDEDYHILVPLGALPAGTCIVFDLRG